MDILVTRKHPSPTQRLLINLLESEKAHVDALLLSLSRVHSANAALAAYAGSGRDQPLSLAIGGVVGVLEEEAHPRMQAYANTLSQTRLGLKEIRDAEENLANITRDRDILVQRMIKQTKKKPSKSELRASAAAAAPSRGGSSLPSSSSVGSFDRAGRLEEAQLELSGCEDALRKEEVHVEEVRRRVLKECVELRLEAMEAAGRSWMEGAKRAGVEIMTYLAEGAPYEHHIPSHLKKNYQGSIESTTPSLAPSQSASQIGRDDDSINSDGAAPSALGLHQQQYAHEPAGSLASVIESDGSSSDGGGSRQRPTLKVFENTRNNGPASPTSPMRAHAPRNPPPAPSSTWNSRVAAKAKAAAQPKAAYGGNDSDSSDAGTLRGSGGKRRAQSDVGRSNASGRRAPLDRRTSNASSISTSMRSDASGADGKQRKKGGFMNAIKALFAPRDKDTLKRGSDRPGSPDSMQHYTSSWSTRTDRNVRRSGGGSEVGTSASGGGGALSWGRKKSRLGAGGDDSSSDDDGPSRAAALVAVTNVGRTAGKKGEASGRTGEWMIEPVGAVRPGIKRSSSSRSTIKAGSSDKKDKRQSMIDFSPSGSKPVSIVGSSIKPKVRAQASSDVGQGTSLKASKSSATLKAKRSESELGPGVKVTTAPPGVKRSSSSSAVPANGAKKSATATNGKASGVTAPKKDAGPAPLPTLVSVSAPRSINPSSSLTLPSAPGSSIVPSASFATPRPPKSSSSATLSPHAADTMSSSMKRSSTFSTGGSAAGSGAATPRPLSVASAIKADKAENFAHSPAHRTASPPPRSALRQPRSMGELKPSALGQPPVLSVPTAPPPPSAFQAPNPAAATGGDEESVYETGLEDNASDDDGNETDRGGPQGITLGKQLNGLTPDLRLASPPGSHNGGGSNVSSSTANGTAVNANGTDTGATVSRRKSVRIEGVPPSPATESPPRQPKPGNYQPPAEKYFDGAVPIDVSGPSAWTSRIKASDAEANIWGGPDSSDDDPDEGEYAMAKRAMQRAARKAEKAKAKGKGRQD